VVWGGRPADVGMLGMDGFEPQWLVQYCVAVVCADDGSRPVAGGGV